MALKITPLTPAIGALIDGVSLSAPLSDFHFRAIGDALLQHHLLFFADQTLSPSQLRAFAARFGDLHVHPLYPNLAPELPDIMLLDSDALHPPDNDRWHTDVTFIDTPPLGTILAAKQLPPGSGGDTLWSSGVAAFDALSPPMQEFLLQLHAEHSFVKSFSGPRYHDESRGDPRVLWEEAVRRHPPVAHPVVRTHPVSKRKALFVNEGFTTRILGVSKAESDAVLGFLFNHVTRPEFTLRWRWRVGDVGFWDNRSTQHYGVADYLPHRRVMHRATILGDKPF